MARGASTARPELVAVARRGYAKREANIVAADKRRRGGGGAAGSARSERREAARAIDKLTRARERLAALEPGGSAALPLEVASASLVEPRAAALGCLRCLPATPPRALRVEAHEAVAVDGKLLRRVALRCHVCGAERAVFVRVVAGLDDVAVGAPRGRG